MSNYFTFHSIKHPISQLQVHVFNGFRLADLEEEKLDEDDTETEVLGDPCSALSIRDDYSCFVSRELMKVKDLLEKGASHQLEKTHHTRRECLLDELIHVIIFCN